MRTPNGRLSTVTNFSRLLVEASDGALDQVGTVSCLDNSSCVTAQKSEQKESHHLFRPLEQRRGYALSTFEVLRHPSFNDRTP